MPDADREFVGSIPELYDRFLVPLIFDAYASDLADRVAALRPHEILETAAGTGALTRAMASRLAADVQIVATDLNQPMLDHAAIRTPTSAHVVWRQADALALPFVDQSFDVVACQFGVMFFPDRVAGYQEARRVLRPGGPFLFSAWDRLSENAFVTVIQEALSRMFPDNPPTFMERTPHGYHSGDAMRGDLQAAGFTSVAIDSVRHTARAATPRDAAIGYCQGSPLRAEIEARGPGRLEEATQAAADALQKEFGSGPIEGQIRANVVSAVG